jgi:hypothetical protein
MYRGARWVRGVGRTACPTFARDVEREVPCQSNPAVHQLDSDPE